MQKQLRSLCGGLTLLVVAAAPASAQVDLNGVFSLTFTSTPQMCRAIFVQNGTSLDFELHCEALQAGGSGTIDPLTGVYSITGSCLIGAGNFGTLQMDGTATPDSSSIAGLFSCPPAFPGPDTYTGTRSCPNGMLDAFEECDDGNFDNNDSCSNFCETIVVPCDDGDLCTRDVVGPMHACTHSATPADGCRTAEKSLLLLKDSDNNTSDKLVWKWLKGAQTTQDDFGMPTGTTAFSLCIYAGSAAGLVARADVPPDATKWQALSDKGWKYNDASGSADGVQKVLLKGGGAGKSKVLMKGKGEDLADLPAQTLPVAVDGFPVTVQLFNNAGICWGSAFESADVKKNEANQFKAKRVE
jgi:cysteine-rich repeat protein